MGIGFRRLLAAACRRARLTLPTQSLRRNSRDSQAKGSSRVEPSRRPCGRRNTGGRAWAVGAAARAAVTCGALIALGVALALTALPNPMHPPPWRSARADRCVEGWCPCGGACGGGAQG